MNFRVKKLLAAKEIMGGPTSIENLTSGEAVAARANETASGIFVIYALANLAEDDFNICGNDKKYWGQFIENHLTFKPLFSIVADFCTKDLNRGIDYQQEFNVELNRQVGLLNPTNPVYRGLLENADPNMGVEGFRAALWTFMCDAYYEYFVV